MAVSAYIMRPMPEHRNGGFLVLPTIEVPDPRVSFDSNRRKSLSLNNS